MGNFDAAVRMAAFDFLEQQTQGFTVAVDMREALQAEFDPILWWRKYRATQRD